MYGTYYALDYVLLQENVSLRKTLYFQIRQPQWPLKTIENYIDIIQTLPDDDTPELLEMHPEITREFKESSAQKFIESLIALQPKTTAADFMVR